MGLTPLTCICTEEECEKVAGGKCLETVVRDGSEIVANDLVEVPCVSALAMQVSSSGASMVQSVKTNTSLLVPPLNLFVVNSMGVAGFPVKARFEVTLVRQGPQWQHLGLTLGADEVRTLRNVYSNE